MHIRYHQTNWEYSTPFKIAYREYTHAETVLVELQDGDRVGRGEAMGIPYYNEGPAEIIAQLEQVGKELPDELVAADLYTLLPPGGARNAVDCALIDLEAKRGARRAWDLLGLDLAMAPLPTFFTLGVNSPENLRRLAAEARDQQRLKLKLNGDRDVDCVRAVREARPDVAIIVDANQSWSAIDIQETAEAMRDLGVLLIEQPLPIGADERLSGLQTAVPLCADESCQTSESLDALVGKYQYVNLKLDKTGGLTEALRTVERARALGFGLMVGCMGGSSLAMAPAFVLGQLAEYIDLDAPLLIKADVDHPLEYRNGLVHAPTRELWG